MTDWYGNGLGAGGWLAMIAMMTILWGLVILAGVMIFRGDGRSRLGGGTQDRGALKILAAGSRGAKSTVKSTKRVEPPSV